jgi:sulfatase maturation enzyme AslB (radical SAM superfamily)
MGAFVKEHDFLMGVSIDGPKDIHDTYRCGLRPLSRA